MEILLILAIIGGATLMAIAGFMDGYEAGKRKKRTGWD